MVDVNSLVGLLTFKSRVYKSVHFASDGNPAEEDISRDSRFIALVFWRLICHFVTQEVNDVSNKIAKVEALDEAYKEIEHGVGGAMERRENQGNII